MFEIPEDELPDILKDEQRINVLFAPLRSGSVNPKDLENKISSWKTIINAYCRNNGYTFSISSLNKVFQRHGRSPSCLNLVIEDMLKNGDIIIIENFLKKPSQSWSGWAADVLVKKPIVWSFSKIKNSVFTTSQESRFVHLDIIKKEAEVVLQSIPDKSKNKLISLSELLIILGKTSKDVENVKLLLHYLSNNNIADVITVTKSDGRDELQSYLVKFSEGPKVAPISEVDISIYTLEQNEKLLSNNVEALEDQIADCIKEAKIHLNKGHRQMAKTCLRKKHELEKRVDKKANALHNVQILLEQIKDAQTDGHVLESYKNALAAFNTSFKETGLSEDAVEDTMLKLADVLDIHADIQTALLRPVGGNDSDLEEELAELLKSKDPNDSPNNTNLMSGIEEDLEKLNINLPNVPDSSPDVSKAEISIV